LRWRDIGTGRTNWRDVWAILQTATRESATGRAILGADAEWGTQEHLLALAVDTLNAANWQRGGGKGRRPKPIQRPGVKPDTEQIQMDRFDSAADFDEWWATH